MGNKLRKPDGDLQSAFEYNPQTGLSLVDIHNMLAAVFGENDGAEWHWIAELKDGKFAYIVGGCDYTGWDCQSSASHQIFSSLKEAVDATPERDSYERPIRDALQKQIEGKEQYGIIVFNYQKES